MYYVIKELRESTGLTQKKFAAMYGIPLSTLRKWEQGEASPAPYVVNLIARTLPATDSGLKKIAGKDGTVFYYDKNQKAVSDARGKQDLHQGRSGRGKRTEPGAVSERSV